MSRLRREEKYAWGKNWLSSIVVLRDFKRARMSSSARAFSGHGPELLLEFGKKLGVDYGEEEAMIWTR